MDSRETKCHGNWGGVTTHWGLPCADERMGKEDFLREGSQEAMGVDERGQEKLAGEEKSISWPAWHVWCGQRWTGWNVEEMEAELRQAGPHRPLKIVSILSEGNRFMQGF